MNAFRAARAYMDAELDGNTKTANPHRLVSMLFEGAIAAIIKAKISNQSGNVQERGKAISMAIGIINSGLKAGINLDEGGDIAQNLTALYDYMVYKLVDANVRADLSMMEEVEGLLKDLKGAWDSIGIAARVKPIPDAVSNHSTVSYERA